MSNMLPTCHIVRFVEERGGVSANVFGSDRNTYHRLKKRGAATHAAIDRFCQKVLNIHPIALYGDSYYADIPEEEGQ